MAKLSYNDSNSRHARLYLLKAHYMLKLNFSQNRTFANYSIYDKRRNCRAHTPLSLFIQSFDWWMTSSIYYSIYMCHGNLIAFSPLSLSLTPTTCRFAVRRNAYLGLLDLLDTVHILVLKFTRCPCNGIELLEGCATMLVFFEHCFAVR